MRIDATNGGGIEVDVIRDMSSRVVSVMVDWRWRPGDSPQPARVSESSSGGIFLTPDEADALVLGIQAAAKLARLENAALQKPGRR